MGAPDNKSQKENFMVKTRIKVTITYLRIDIFCWDVLLVIFVVKY